MYLKLNTIFIIKIKVIGHIIKKKKKAFNTCIFMDTFKIEHNLYHKNMNNQSKKILSKRNQPHIKILTQI